MSPHEIVIPGGGNEHFNDEPGRVWLERAITQWPSYIWINQSSKNIGSIQNSNIIKIFLRIDGNYGLRLQNPDKPNFN